jgi:hypothetical protein
MRHALEARLARWAGRRRSREILGEEDRDVDALERRRRAEHAVFFDERRARGLDERAARFEPREAEALAERIERGRGAPGDELAGPAVDAQEPRKEAGAELAAGLFVEVDALRDDGLLDEGLGERLGRDDLERAQAEVEDGLPAVRGEGQARAGAPAAGFVERAARGLADARRVVAVRRRQGARGDRAGAASALARQGAPVRIVRAAEGHEPRGPRERERPREAAPRDDATGQGPHAPHPGTASAPPRSTSFANAAMRAWRSAFVTVRRREGPTSSTQNEPMAAPKNMARRSSPVPAPPERAR